jgi:two-component system, sensor histidine kinase and response regulator
MTAHAMQGDREDCMAAGMDDYISKPLRMERLIEAVEAAAAVGIARNAVLTRDSDLPEGYLMANLDREMALARVGGDSALLGELAALFLDEYPQLMRMMRESLDGPDGAKISGPAHQLKGLLGQFGAEGARHVALELELAGKRGDFEGARQSFSRLDALMEALRPELESMGQSSK